MKEKTAKKISYWQSQMLYPQTSGGSWLKGEGSSACCARVMQAEYSKYTRPTSRSEMKEEIKKINIKTERMKGRKTEAPEEENVVSLRNYMQ